MVLLRGTRTGYELSIHDEDLQENPPLQGFQAKCYANAKIKNAKQRALIRLCQATQLSHVKLDDFEITSRGVGDAGPQTPVEWTYQETVSHGDHQRTWMLMIDIDDVPAGTGGHGPDRPHVGYSFWCKYVNGGTNTDRVNGHIFVDYVNATRS